jgi:hypothetical protein
MRYALIAVDHLSVANEPTKLPNKPSKRCAMTPAFQLYLNQGLIQSTTQIMDILIVPDLVKKLFSHQCYI